jgi:ABC-type polysaccharide/polyol phosphate export permease
MKDVSQIIRVIIRLGFWFTPIFWEITMLPPKYQVFFKLNPVYYLINGYRNTFFYKVWFWEHLSLTAYFWILTLGIFIVGAVVFKRLRPHFADVL